MITFEKKPAIDPMSLIRFLQTSKNATMAGPERLRVAASGATPEARIELVKRVLSNFTPLNEEKPAEG